MTGVRGPRLSGLISLNKPTGVTSRHVVNRVVRVVGRRVKVGHAGTLDPLASGVLVVCLGAATRLIEYVQRQRKVYTTVVRLGARSDTLDADGSVEAVDAAADPGVEAVAQAVAGQMGTFLQVPPQFSALKVGGKRAYDLARAGEDVELAPRPVTIYRAESVRYEWPRLELEIECEGGTYVRSVARDVGETLGCGGLVEMLVRTRIGGFRLENSLDPESLTAENLTEHLLPARSAVVDLPSLTLAADQVAAVIQGRAIPGPAGMKGEVALLEPEGELVAVGVVTEGRVAPKRVLVGQH